MRKLCVLMILVLVLASWMLAGEVGKYSCTVTNCVAAYTNTVTSGTMDGYIEAIRLTAETGWTGTVSVVAGSETVLTASGISASASYYPRRAACNSAGGSLGTTNEFVRYCIAGETIAVTVSSTQVGSTNNVKVRVRMEK